VFEEIKRKSREADAQRRKVPPPRGSLLQPMPSAASNSVLPPRGERCELLTRLGGAIIIVVGVLMTTKAQSRKG
jgi:hypothetical protein